MSEHIKPGYLGSVTPIGAESEIWQEWREAQERITELETQLAASQTQNHTQLEQRQFVANLIDNMPMNVLQEENEQLRVQLAEANTFRDSAMEFITNNCGVDHSQMSFPDFLAQGGSNCSLCLSAKLTTAEAEVAAAQSIIRDLRTGAEVILAERDKLRAALEPILKEATVSIGPRSLMRHFQVFGTVAVQLSRAQVEALQAALTAALHAEKGETNG